MLAIGLAVAAWRARRARTRRLSVAAAGAALGGALALLAAAVIAPPVGQPVYLTPDGSARAPRFTQHDPELGYAPRPSAQVRARSYHGARLLYDVLYTIDGGGLRATQGDADGDGVVFFGCSFTFGEGLDDAQSLPWRFSAALGGRANVLNAGFQGYGPHQMLRSLETDRLRERVRSGVKHVVYQALGAHVARSAGGAPWDAAGPRYELDGEAVRYAGPFHTPLGALAVRVANRLALSGVLPGFAPALDGASLDDRERFVRIVVRSAALARERWGAGFTVLFWDDNALDHDLVARLVTRGIDVVRVSSILSPEERARLMIPVDGHPGGAATSALAAGLATHLAPAIGR